MKKVLLGTTNPAVWAKARKGTEADCSHCPWHRGENFHRHGDDSRSWKKYRRHQYRRLGA